jgi:septal ring factor EnvC (AmiA/AmiB activator)
MAAAWAFIASPIGRWVVIGFLLVGWTVYQREQAADKARDECQDEQLQKTVDEITRQRDAARQALADAETQRQKTEAEMEQLENERDRIVSDLQERAADSCVIPDDAIERLRNIR